MVNVQHIKTNEIKIRKKDNKNTRNKTRWEVFEKAKTKTEKKKGHNISRQLANRISIVEIKKKEDFPLEREKES